MSLECLTVLYLTVTNAKFIDMKTTETQVGGNHYKNMKMQPVKLFALTKCTAFQANIWKYITRYKQKNGKEDIKKAMHYAELAIELKCDGEIYGDKLKSVERFCEINELSAVVAQIVLYAAYNHYRHVIQKCKELIANEYPD